MNAYPLLWFFILFIYIFFDITGTLAYFTNINDQRISDKSPSLFNRSVDLRKNQKQEHVGFQIYCNVSRIQTL